MFLEIQISIQTMKDYYEFWTNSFKTSIAKEFACVDWYSIATNVRFYVLAFSCRSSVR